MWVTNLWLVIRHMTLIDFIPYLSQTLTGLFAWWIESTVQHKLCFLFCCGSITITIPITETATDHQLLSEHRCWTNSRNASLDTLFSSVRLKQTICQSTSLARDGNISTTDGLMTFQILADVPSMTFPLSEMSQTLLNGVGAQWTSLLFYRHLLEHTPRGFRGRHKLQFLSRWGRHTATTRSELTPGVTERTAAMIPCTGASENRRRSFHLHVHLLVRAICTERWARAETVNNTMPAVMQTC